MVDREGKEKNVLKKIPSGSKAKYLEGIDQV
jgi:hypothetical protein